MKWTKYIAAALLTLGVVSDLWAAEPQRFRWFQVNTRIRLEYDDNVYLTDQNTDESFKFIGEAEFFVNLNLEQTYVSLRYRPSYVWWDNRTPDDSDFHHDLDFVFTHTFTPRLSLSLKDTFRLGELPELIDRGTTVRENDDFIYNTANGTLSYLFAPETRIDLAGRYNTLQYDDSEVANREDYDLWVAGLTWRQQLVPEMAVNGEIRLEGIDYSGPDRGSDGYQIGGGVERTFNPNLLGDARLAWQHKDYNNAKTDSGDSPAIEGAITYLPSPATRLSAGLGYGLYETDVFPFTNQERFQFFGSLAHDYTARVSWYITGSYALSSFDAQETLAESAPVQDGDENIFQLSTRLAYRLNRSNTLEAGWQLVNLDSDVRENYLRNRISLGWKTEL